MPWQPNFKNIANPKIDVRDIAKPGTLAYRRMQVVDKKQEQARLVRYKDINYQGLRKAIEHSRRRLQPYREKRVSAVREFVGRNYSTLGRVIASR